MSVGSRLPKLLVLVGGEPDVAEQSRGVRLLRGTRWPTSAPSAAARSPRSSTTRWWRPQSGSPTTPSPWVTISVWTSRHWRRPWPSVRRRERGRGCWLGGGQARCARGIYLRVGCKGRRTRSGARRRGGGQHNAGGPAARGSRCRGVGLSVVDTWCIVAFWFQRCSLESPLGADRSNETATGLVGPANGSGDCSRYLGDTVLDVYREERWSSTSTDAGT